MFTDGREGQSSRLADPRRPAPTGADTIIGLPLKATVADPDVWKMVPDSRSPVADSRRRPSENVSLSGQLLPYLWLIVGVALVLSGASNVDGGRWFLLGPGILCLIVTAGIWRVDWGTVPSWFVRAIPYAGLALLAVVGYGAPHADRALLVVMALAMMFTGVALERADLVGVSLCCAVAIVIPQWAQYPPATAFWHSLEAWLIVTAGGVAMHWLRWQMDLTAEAGALAVTEAAEAQTRAMEERQRAEAERAALTREELAERSRLQEQVAEQTAALAVASVQVRRQTTSVAEAADHMAHALSELTRTAQATDAITAGVASKAQDASAVMEALKISSAQIMAASDVIQAIAEQTNLLALNATIESARAGEAGRGFAVVANEVKDLARQTGENADAITRTLAEVQTQVSAAVVRVDEITASMGELASHNGALAAAIEEQSASVQQVSRSVQDTSTEVGSMNERVQALERLSHAG